MVSKKQLSMEVLLNNPEIKQIIDRVSPEEAERRTYSPPKCEAFTSRCTVLNETDEYKFFKDLEAQEKLPHIIHNKVQLISGMDEPDQASLDRFTRELRIGIVFSGGPAPGGHNVIAGLFDAAKNANPKNRIFGFLLGPDGIVESQFVEITESLVDAYRNLGGFSMIKTGRTKIDTAKKVRLSRETCKKLKLKALVVVGGDDSNTNAAFLAQELYKDGIQVIGVPKTIDGDIQVQDSEGKNLCAMSFGFHTAARSFARNIGGLCIDSNSDVKYWHICKVMGRVASHLALEVALQTHANMTLIGEDLADYVDEARLEKARKEGTTDYTAYGMTLRHLSRLICEAITRRAAVGKNYGVIVIPEGVLEYINEIQLIITKLNTVIADFNNTHDKDFHTTFPTLESKLEYLRRLVRGIRPDLSPALWNAHDDELFNDMPEFFQKGLLLERDSHGNFQFSQVETDQVIMQMVKDYLSILKEKGRYTIGIERGYFRSILERDGLDPDFYGPVMFQNYGDGEYLLIKKSIMSMKTLKLEFTKSGKLETEEELPSAIEHIYSKSVPKLKTQTHFFGYDGRGSDPTRFDCDYTYNLGQTVFSLVVNGATGQMAAIKNLEQDFSRWEPIGIPIAPLMRLEERKGKMTLVIEKSLVDLESNAFRVVKALREKWLAASPGDDEYRSPGPIRFTGKSEEDRPITLILNAVGKY
ncbi:MAG: 6-phosphofructokinase [Proteobacteria bacterium]|nr:6-phosphofructokinase [Pseudomonadota bacterium]